MDVYVSNPGCNVNAICNLAVGGELLFAVSRGRLAGVAIVSVRKNQLDSTGDVSILIAVLFCQVDSLPAETEHKQDTSKNYETEQSDYVGSSRAHVGEHPQCPVAVSFYQDPLG
jgi:hypothetical protein